MKRHPAFLRFSTATLAAFLLIGPAWAQHAPQAAAPRAGQLSMEDRRFMKEAMAGGRFEVEASRLAVQRAQEPDVKAYAALLVKHHEHANAQLARIAGARGVTPPLGDNRSRKLIKDLSRMDGRKFDREYIEKVGLKMHKADIDNFEDAQRGAADPLLRGWIETTLPLVREHYAQAQRLAGRR